MVEFRIIFTKDAQQDSLKLKATGLKDNSEKLLRILEVNPFQNPPSYEKLTGNFKGCYSRRINIKHRLVYEVLKDEKTVKVLRMWSHYE
jgi:toxin YoeB